MSLPAMGPPPSTREAVPGSKAGMGEAMLSVKHEKRVRRTKRGWKVMKEEVGRMLGVGSCFGDFE